MFILCVCLYFWLKPSIACNGCYVGLPLILYSFADCKFVGNYYSIREQHEHAVLYFQRALKLDPNFISAWTLMGHEYMELNNQSAAIQAYRQGLGTSHSYTCVYCYLIMVMSCAIYRCDNLSVS